MNREAERKRLVEVLKDGHSLYISRISGKTMYEEIADYLLDNGVIVPPCKVGDTVYVTDIPGFEGIVTECVIVCFNDVDKNGVGSMDYEPIEDIPDVVSIGSFVDDFGKTVFLTREEALKALEGSGEK